MLAVAGGTGGCASHDFLRVKKNIVTITPRRHY